MADFKIAFDITNKNEGTYSNDSLDNGGETYCGISRKNFPHWEGWIEIDEYKINVSNFPSCLKLNEYLPEMIESFYKENFWDKIRGDEIPNQDLANQTYDMSVNSGVHEALKLLA